jgi:hypothetical protein
MLPREVRGCFFQERVFHFQLAVSSVWTTTAPGTTWAMRAAGVVFPLLLRPSTARTAGRPKTDLPVRRE